MPRFCMLVYINDFIILSKTFEEHLVHVKQILRRLADAGLKVKPSKCFFAMNEVDFLGHRVSAAEIARVLDESRQGLRCRNPPP